ncbi:MAG: DUF3426 domain-containing protein [Gammaproteobacteria bacterium]|nr:DUF3426 domain-containing protein [Gammaproteobacteria bacterium]
METLCPFCQTRFRLNEEQLLAANGRAHCCRCSKIFDARENLLIEPVTPQYMAQDSDLERGDLFALPPEPAPTESIAEALAREDNWSNFEIDSTPTGILYKPHDEMESWHSPNWPEERGSNTDVDQEQIFDEINQMATAYDLNLGDIDQLPEHEPLCIDTEEPFILDIPVSELPHFPDPEPTTTEPFESIEELSKNESDSSLESDLARSLEIRIEPNSRHPWRALFWMLGILLLITTAAGQIAWFQRSTLIQYPEGKVLLQKSCDILGCQLPVQQAPENIIVISRSVSASSGVDGALEVELVMHNTNQFPQPYPTLQISLFDRNERLVARRHFTPEQYLSEAKLSSQLLPADTTFRGRLSLRDPGPKVSGFKFEFY